MFIRYGAQPKKKKEAYSWRFLPSFLFFIFFFLYFWLSEKEKKIIAHEDKKKKKGGARNGAYSHIYDDRLIKIEICRIVW